MLTVSQTRLYLQSGVPGICKHAKLKSRKLFSSSLLLTYRHGILQGGEAGKGREKNKKKKCGKGEKSALQEDG